MILVIVVLRFWHRSLKRPKFVNIVAAVWNVFCIEAWRSVLGTLRVANRSPTATSKTNDVLGPFDEIWRIRGRRVRLLRGPAGRD